MADFVENIQFPVSPCQALFDGRDASGAPAASGLYLFVVDTPAGRLVRRGVLLR